MSKISKKSYFFVAIILLGGFIFLSFNGPGREKSRGSAVKGGLASIRTQGELYFDMHNNSYGRTTFPVGSCVGINTGEDKNLFNDQSIQLAIRYVDDLYDEYEVVCAYDATRASWAVSAEYTQELYLPWYLDLWYFIVGWDTTRLAYWCVDSTLASREVAHHITEAKCPEGIVH